MLHAVLDKFIDAPAYVVHRAENVAVESELHAVDVALVALAAGLKRRHGEIETLLARLGDGRELFDSDRNLRWIAPVVPRGLG